LREQEKRVGEPVHEKGGVEGTGKGAWLSDGNQCHRNEDKEKTWKRGGFPLKKETNWEDTNRGRGEMLGGCNRAK